ncbi:hypothetical protein Tco_1237388 [Tanacetum coccineum]
MRTKLIERAIHFDLQPVTHEYLKWSKLSAGEKNAYNESCEDDLLDMIKIEYMHEDGDVFEDHSWEDVYSNGEKVYREWCLEFFSMSNVYRSFCSSGDLDNNNQEEKLADIRALAKCSKSIKSESWDDRMFGKALDRRAKKLSLITLLKGPPQASNVPREEPSHSMPILHHLADEANFAYPPYEPPDVPPYPGGQYGAPGNDYLFTGAMPSHGVTSIVVAAQDITVEVRQEELR